DREASSPCARRAVAPQLLSARAAPRCGRRGVHPDRLRWRPPVPELEAAATRRSARPPPPPATTRRATARLRGVPALAPPPPREAADRAHAAVVAPPGGREAVPVRPRGGVRGGTDHLEPLGPMAGGQARYGLDILVDGPACRGRRRPLSPPVPRRRVHRCARPRRRADRSRGSQR